MLQTVSAILGTPRIFIAENGGVLSYSEDELRSGYQQVARMLLRLSEEFILKKYDSSRKYRFTDVILRGTSI